MTDILNTIHQHQKKYQKMGCCCSAPCPPPDQSLVGTWVNVPEADTMYQPGTHWHRVQSGYGLYPKVRLPEYSTSDIFIKLVLTPEGVIIYKFVDRTSGFTKLIDTTVGSWDDGIIKTNCCGTSLEYKKVIVEDENYGTRRMYLEVDGHRLHKKQNG